MPKERLPLKDIIEILRLKSAGFSDRKTAQMLNIHRTTVSKYLDRANELGISYPLPETTDPSTLNEQFFCLDAEETVTTRPLPDFKEIAGELRKHPHLTLMQLHREYKEQYEDGIGYTQFCERYRKFINMKAATMHFEHKAGEKLFIDYSGDTVPIFDQKTDEIDFLAQIFVGVLGASNYTYACATQDQKTLSWITGCIQAFEYCGGIPVAIVPDNAKAAVYESSRYEPIINEAFLEFARYYLVEVIPTRVRKPRDKAKVENHVLIVERSILARLRNIKFYSLDKLNEAILELLDELNNKELTNKDGTRQTLFDEIDKPLLKPLPQTRYEYGIWKKAAVQTNYHICHNYRWYSVPYSYIGKQVDMRITNKIVEIFKGGVRIASHKIATYKGEYVTIKGHMPPNHNYENKWTEEYILKSAENIGDYCQKLLNGIMERKYVKEQGFKACQGILSFPKTYGNDRVEKACERAFKVGSFSFKSVESILKQNLDQEPLEEEVEIQTVDHPNIRGEEYFHSKIENEANNA